MTMRYSVALPLVSGVHSMSGLVFVMFPVGARIVTVPGGVAAPMVKLVAGV